MLDDLGLLPALEALVDRRREGGLPIVTQLSLPDPQVGQGSLDPDLETTIYRVVQESLTNIVKHANANSVRVAVVCKSGEVTIEVQDDGVGFDIDAQASGFGLPGMQERVYLAGGTIDVRSTDRGTLVRACMPAAPYEPQAGSAQG
jgi:signal transduction histidine kinase